MHVQRGCGSPAGHAPGLAESRSSWAWGLLRCTAPRRHPAP